MRVTASDITWLLIVGALSFLAMSSTASSQEWTGPGSEEDPPRACTTGTALNGFKCTGRYCDNVNLKCAPLPTNSAASSRKWQGYFSEEGTSTQLCQFGAHHPRRGYITGMACKGAYCDNISLECTNFNIEFHDCHWTGWVSEEAGGELLFPQGYLAAGAECSGGYCDNMRFLICAPTEAIFRAYRQGLTPTHGGTWTTQPRPTVVPPRQ
jgi:hypothetical protein